MLLIEFKNRISVMMKAMKPIHRPFLPADGFSAD